MAAPSPGFVHDLAGTFDQAGDSGSSAAPGSNVASAAPPATTSAPSAATHAPTLSVAHAPALSVEATATPTAALFIPPALVFPFVAAPAAPAAAPASSQLGAVYINQHVPVVLSLQPSNYSTWRTMFELAFAKFGVMEHILGVPRPMDAQWVQNDAFIMSWMYNRVSPEILSLVHQRHPTAAGVWRAVNSLFLDNAETQVVFLGTAFCSLEQGDLSMKRYFVSRSPFPSFLRCRAFMILEETHLNMASPAPTDTALHAGHAPAPPAPAPAPAPTNNNTGRNNNRNRNRGKGKAVQQNGDAGGSSSGSSSTGSQTAGRLVQLPAPAMNPWTGMVHAWPMSWRPHAPGAGVLGPRPDAPSPFAGHAAQYVPLPPPAAPHGAAWDQASLIQALNNMSLQQ
ncbi:hypothetical protein ACQ4PT_045349 [Festuca glaucescens]